MKYDDLLNVPFRKFGRDKSGFDCYGLVMECCKRAGTPLKDLYGGIVDLPAGEVESYVKGGLNVRKIPKPKVGALAYCMYKGNTHVGYIVERGKILHATIEKGVRVAPLEILHPIAFFEVIDESKPVQGTVEQQHNN